MSNYDDHRIPFAVGPDGLPTSIYEVERGLACGCTCPNPECGARLVAKKGEVQVWHFAHESNANCHGALESSIHIAVKRIISQEKRMRLPPCNVLRYPDDVRLKFSCPPSSGEYSVPPYRYTKQLWAYKEEIRRCGGGVVSIPSEDRMFEFDEIYEEISQGNIRPDLVAVIKGRRLYIEVAVKHPVDSEKLKRIRGKGVAAVQISVPHDDALAMNMERLRELVIDSVVGKVWIFNPIVEEKAEQDFVEKAPFRARRKAAIAKAAKEKAAQADREETDRLNRQRFEEEQRVKDEAEAALREAARLARVAEQNLVYAQKREAREAAEAARQAQQLMLRKEREEAAIASQRALKERILSQPPSFEYPLEKSAIVLFVDLDCLLEYGGLDLLGRTLGSRSFNIVVTSRIRRTAILKGELCSRLLPLKGRPVRVTSILGEEGMYGLRKEEVEHWLKENVTKEWGIDRHLIIDTGWYGLGYPHIAMHPGGFTVEHAQHLRALLRITDPDSDEIEF